MPYSKVCYDAIEYDVIPTFTDCAILFWSLKIAACSKPQQIELENDYALPFLFCI